MSIPLAPLRCAKGGDSYALLNHDCHDGVMMGMISSPLDYDFRRNDEGVRAGIAKGHPPSPLTLCEGGRFLRAVEP